MSNVRIQGYMYISNGHYANLRSRLTSSDWLKVDFWKHGPVAADTLYRKAVCWPSVRCIYFEKSFTEIFLE